MNKIAIIMAVMCGSQAVASSWVRVGGGSDGTQLSIDMDSVRKDGDIAQSWIELNYAKVRSEPARSSKELWKFRCSQRTSFTASQIFYRADGSVLRSKSPIETSYDYEPVAPDTLGERVMLVVCR